MSTLATLDKWRDQNRITATAAIHRDDHCTVLVVRRGESSARVTFDAACLILAADIRMRLALSLIEAGHWLGLDRLPQLRGTLGDQAAGELAAIAKGAFDAG